MLKHPNFLKSILMQYLQNTPGNSFDERIGRLEVGSNCALLPRLRCWEGHGRLLMASWEQPLPLALGFL